MFRCTNAVRMLRMFNLQNMYLEVSSPTKDLNLENNPDQNYLLIISYHDRHDKIKGQLRVDHLNEEERKNRIMFKIGDIFNLERDKRLEKSTSSQRRGKVSSS